MTMLYLNLCYNEVFYKGYVRTLVTKNSFSYFSTKTYVVGTKTEPGIVQTPQ